MNHSVHGIDTTRAEIPSAASSSRAATAICTSEPVPMRMTSVPSAITYPPRAASAAGAKIARSNVGTFCRLRHRAAGRSVISRIACQAAAVSLASAGRTTSRPRDVPQRPQVLDRLVGRAVLAEADRVVRPDVGDRLLHQRRQPHGPAHVVAELQERAAVDAGAAVHGDAVQDRAHAVLADAEVQRPAVRVARPHLGLAVGGEEGRLALHRGEVGLGQVGRAAPQLRQHRRERGQHLARGLAGGRCPSGRPGTPAARPSTPAGRVCVAIRAKSADRSED